MSVSQDFPELSLDALAASRLDGVVAIESIGEDKVAVYRRDGGSVAREDMSFHPFLLAETPSLLDGAGLDFEIKRLERSNPGARLGFILSFETVADYRRATDFLSRTNRGARCRLLGDLQNQALTALNLRLFGGMSFNDVRRLQLDIETVTSDGEFSNPLRPGDEIIIISLSDNSGWETALCQESMTEAELIAEAVRIINERDPDIIEGHNLFRFDLPFITARAKRHKVALPLGRDGSNITKRRSRLAVAERTINYDRYEIHGRHIIDTYHLAMLYDISHRDLPDYGLKTIARHFRVAATDRVYIDGGDISGCWERARQRLLKYALDDVRETRAVAAILSPSYFYQARLVPYGYQSVVSRGNATKIEALMTAEYLRRGLALPQPEPPRRFVGALTKAAETGVFENVWHCDVRSLYPSIILAEKMNPSRDAAGVFSETLGKLRGFRLQAKDRERQSDDDDAKDRFNSLQTSFKILINSFYGYLGFAQASFNDFDMAEKVTAKGREILAGMERFLTDGGALIIEMDTDGIYFQPPPDENSREDMCSRIQEALPEGIEVELDSVHKAMFCYKSKNYALLGDDGEVAITGAALKSRGLEPFQREYIKELLTLLLQRRESEAAGLHLRYEKALKTHSMPLEKLAKSETLNGSVEKYKRKLAENGRRSAAFELAMRSNRDYRSGDKVSFYVTGDKKKVSVVENAKLLADAGTERDENVAYYLGKLEDLRQKFAEFVPPDDKQPELGF